MVEAEKIMATSVLHGMCENALVFRVAVNCNEFLRSAYCRLLKNTALG